ncbi:hypothetical protein TVAG_224560 [Trichomonas vaginalis G3]|uniref:Uncharacterized protein n=1 Tax=Trichomonas vaginalis (strain ATCC PRA-98 / G3) TaxID=412133 RepID=A2DW79_TRIV3|nr:hypothetical protein TVAGG3_0804330 [Trichomonas vaginalis G3]EAY15380.1 hypothetical protein TVAG_224560 [Trichomonas vaginalis G3]KAI5496745.1 hypothetical protein TVAGG3_0804330 [Trichomonas vaginalis G3]|eukprot:XP_001327603.1 hypothetical protein [Trichomonas vaginalis G3]
MIDYKTELSNFEIEGNWTFAKAPQLIQYEPDVLFEDSSLAGFPDYLNAKLQEINQYVNDRDGNSLNSTLFDLLQTFNEILPQVSKEKVNLGSLVDVLSENMFTDLIDIIGSSKIPSNISILLKIIIRLSNFKPLAEYISKSNLMEMLPELFIGCKDQDGYNFATLLFIYIPIYSKIDDGLDRIVELLQPTTEAMQDKMGINWALDFLYYVVKYAKTVDYETILNILPFRLCIPKDNESKQRFHWILKFSTTILLKSSNLFSVFTDIGAFSFIYDQSIMFFNKNGEELYDDIKISIIRFLALCIFITNDSEIAKLALNVPCAEVKRLFLKETFTNKERNVVLKFFAEISRLIPTEFYNWFDGVNEFHPFVADILENYSNNEKSIVISIIFNLADSQLSSDIYGMMFEHPDIIDAGAALYEMSDQNFQMKFVDILCTITGTYRTQITDELVAIISDNDVIEMLLDSDLASNPDYGVKISQIAEVFDELTQTP